jgi:hypothetical protein
MSHLKSGRSAPPTVLPCPKCGSPPILAFDLVRAETWGHIQCASCGYCTKDSNYRTVKAEWNGDRQPPGARPLPARD